MCALAHNAAVLIAGRCLQGCGGGGLIILTYVVMASLFSLEKRSQYTSVIGMIWTVGTVCGPVIGGGFAEISWVIYHIQSSKLHANHFNSAEFSG